MLVIFLIMSYYFLHHVAYLILIKIYSILS